MMKNLLKTIFFTFFFMPPAQSMNPYESICSVVVPALGTQVDTETKINTRNILKNLGHKSPKSVHLVFNDALIKREHQDALAAYEPFSNTIILSTEKNIPDAEFTIAHEAAHATFHPWRVINLVTMRSSFYFGACYIFYSPLFQHKMGYWNAVGASFSILSIARLFYGFAEKKIMQNMEWQAEIEAAKVLLKLNKKPAVEAALNSFITRSKEELLTASTTENKEKTAKKLGFYLNETRCDFNLSKGTSETWWSNWDTHPTKGKRYFEIKSLLANKK